MLHLIAAVGAMASCFPFDLLPSALSQPLQADHAAAVTPDAIVGQASVIDGDTLEIHGVRIRLHAIDAPESDQLCLVREEKVRCGQQAAFALADRIDRGIVACEPRDRDRYGRIVAVCRLGRADLNEWMVAEGWAMAYRDYSTDYAQQEQAADAAKIGIWAGSFVAPWEWRRGERIAAEVLQSEGGCVIMGNISSKGERIYHIPGGYYYSKTKISQEKGERWFCIEADAQTAGWRRSKR